MSRNMVGATTLAYMRGEKDFLAERAKIAEMRRQLKASGLVYWLNNHDKRKVQKIWQMVSLLVEDSRMPLTEMSRKLGVPVSTLFDLLKEIRKVFHFTIMLKGDENQIVAQNVLSLSKVSLRASSEIPRHRSPPLSLAA